MIQQSNFESQPLKASKDQMPQSVVEHLRVVVHHYLEKRPHLSINGISKKCSVSEPTLRRIMSGKVKTVPQITTLLDILTFVANTTQVRELVKRYPGPIADHLLETMPYLEDVDQDYSTALNEELKDPIKYLIYKMSLNHCGVTERKIAELYGKHGLQLLQDLTEKGYIQHSPENIFRAKARVYGGSHKDFVKNFKLIADFIKTDKLQNRKPLNPYFVNMSDSLSVEAYDKIRRLQSQLDKKIRKIVSEESSKGEIPFFYIGAIDTLDLKSAYELAEENNLLNKKKK